MMFVGADCSYYPPESEVRCGAETVWLERHPQTGDPTGVYCRAHRTSACVPIEGDLVKAPRSTFWGAYVPAPPAKPNRAIDRLMRWKNR